MVTRSATAEWRGDVKAGQGELRLGSQAWSGPYSFQTRFDDQPGTNPEELLGAAHAGCFSMAFSLILGEAGFKPEHIETTAQVRLVKDNGGFRIDQVTLATQATVPHIDEHKFQELASQAKTGCPVSKALAGTNITLEAKLTSS